MPIKINCQFNDQGAWCKCAQVKRSLFGIGARCCVEFPRKDNVCPHRMPYVRPSIPPSPPIPQAQR